MATPCTGNRPPRDRARSGLVALPLGPMDELLARAQRGGPPGPLQGWLAWRLHARFGVEA